MLSECGFLKRKSTQDLIAQVLNDLKKKKKKRRRTWNYYNSPAFIKGDIALAKSFDRRRAAKRTYKQ